MIRLWKGYHSRELRDAVARAWEHEELLIVCPPRLESLSFVQALPEAEIELAGDWGEHRAAAEAELRGFLTRASAAPVLSARPVLGVFTSGTANGKPRLVLYSRANLEASLKGVRSFFDVARISALFCYPQPFHIFGLALGYVHSLLYGLPLYFAEGHYRRTAHEAWLRVEEKNLLTLGTPTHFHDLALARHGAHPRPTYSAIIGGASVSVELWRSLQESLCIESPSIGYGASEASPAITHHPPGLMPREDGEIGSPIPGVTIALKPGAGLEFEGANLCLAIIQEDADGVSQMQAPTRLLIKDDLALREDGMLIFRGRHELVLNRGGQKFSLERMEASLRERFGISALCVAVRDPRLVEELGVIVRAPAIPSAPSEVAPASRDEIFRFLRESFGASFDAKNFVETPEFPINVASKVDRHACARLLDANTSSLSWPVPVSQLRDWLPHREEAIWIDEVRWARDDEGECSLTLSAESSALSREGVRVSSFVEWIAQGYGYVQACRLLERHGESAKRPERAFLVGLKDVECPGAEILGALKVGQKLTVHVKKTHQFGPIALIEGQIRGPDGQRLAGGQIRLYAE